jgi:Zn-dependent protease
MGTIVSIFAFIAAIAAHEFAHAWSAHSLGDMTARSSGRMTLNPLAHIDLFGTILLPAMLIFARFPVVFGWAKPVPVNPANFASPRKGMMMTSAAGPLANFILAGIFSVLLRSLSGAPSFPPLLSLFFVYSILINVVIGLFNLIPLPPLDGSNILAGLLPERAAASYMKLSKYGLIFLVAFLYLGLFDRLIMPVASMLIHLLTR